MAREFGLLRERRHDRLRHAIDRQHEHLQLLPGTWSDVHVQIDSVALLADVDVNGTLEVTDLPTEPKVLPPSLYGVPAPLDHFVFSGNNFSGAGTSAHFLDDVRVDRTETPVGVEDRPWTGMKSLFL